MFGLCSRTSLILISNGMPVMLMRIEEMYNKSKYKGYIIAPGKAIKKLEIIVFDLFSAFRRRLGSPQFFKIYFRIDAGNNYYNLFFLCMAFMALTV